MVKTVVTSLALGPRRRTTMLLQATDIVPLGLGIAGTAFLDDYILTIDWSSRNAYLDPIAPPSRRSGS
jgi:hypothetical protein